MVFGVLKIAESAACFMSLYAKRRVDRVAIWGTIGIRVDVGAAGGAASKTVCMGRLFSL